METKWTPLGAHLVSAFGALVAATLGWKPAAMGLRGYVVIQSAGALLLTVPEEG